MTSDTNDNAYPTVHIESDAYIKMTSPDGLKSYALFKRAESTSGEIVEVNCVESYTLTGGPQEPFECLSMKVPKKKLLDISKDFEKTNSIVPGKTRLSVNYIGHCDNMVVTKCKLTGSDYVITAYHESEAIKGMSFKGSYTAKRPLEMIQYILEELDSQLGLSDHYGSVNHQYFRYDSSLDTDEMISVGRGKSMWSVLQLCAFALGCRVFFSGDIVYMVDYRLPFAGSYSKDKGLKDHFLIDLYGDSDTGSLRKTLVAAPEYGQEGFDTVSNSIRVYLNSSTVIGTQNVQEIYVTDAGSISRYGERVANDMRADIFGLYWGTVAGAAYINYLAEPQQSITFEVKELSFSTDADNYGIRWGAQFPKVTRVGKFVDSNAEMTLINEDMDGSIHPQKLYLSSYQRNFPEGTSTYSFGVIENISLSQSTSNIMTALGSR